MYAFSIKNKEANMKNYSYMTMRFALVENRGPVSKSTSLPSSSIVLCSSLTERKRTTPLEEESFDYKNPHVNLYSTVDLHNSFGPK